jgi:Spy/CpxP family protein refolding chaperone
MSTGERRLLMRTPGFLIAALVFAAGIPLTAAHAQGGGFGRMNEGLVDSMRAQLELTKEQEAAVSGIFKVSQERRQELRDRYQGQRNREGVQAIRAEMQAIRTEADEQLELVLTAEQMEQYHALRARLQERFRSQRRGRRPPRSR